MKLDTSSPIPLHVQLRDILRKEILDGNFTDGRIPSERELMETFSVSRTTVREAVASLVHEGVLEKQHGRGTFVSFRPVEEWLGSLKSYTETIESLGMKPGSKLLYHGVEASPKHLADTMGLDEVYVIARLRLADGIPLAIERDHFPVEVGRRLAEHDLDKAVYYTILEQSLGITLYEADLTIMSSIPTEEDADLLGIPKSTSVLVTERLTLDINHELVEYSRQVFRSDMYAFRVKMMRHQGIPF